jgi:hypothetical protein
VKSGFGPPMHGQKVRLSSWICLMFESDVTLIRVIMPILGCVHRTWLTLFVLFRYRPIAPPHHIICNENTHAQVTKVFLQQHLLRAFTQ